MKLLKKGNAKISKDCLVFNLPTSVCPVICDGCYARKAESRFSKVLESRNRNYNESLDQIRFINKIHDEIVMSRKFKCRIHESGDFYSQQYINAWYNIISHLPYVLFYAYTKREQDFNFGPIKELGNFNLINSLTPLGLNYGDSDFCNILVENHDYILCPCKKGTDIICMEDCNLCLNETKVCFLKH